MTKLTKIEGIGETYAARLETAGIDSVEKLLELGATPEGRETLTEKSGITRKLILEWVNLADLMRIKGIGEEYADLLEEAGVDTVKELRRRNPDNLHAWLIETNKEKRLVRQVPGRNQVADWIEQAKELPSKVAY